jgi:hypothetical protein
VGTEVEAMKVVAVNEEKGIVQKKWKPHEIPNVYDEMKKDEQKQRASTERDILNAGETAVKDLFNQVMGIPTFGYRGHTNESIRQWIYWLKAGKVTKEQFLEFHHWVPTDEELAKVEL